MLHEDQPARPWGTVTPDFWAIEDEDGPKGDEAPATAGASLPELPPANDFARRFAELAARLDGPRAAIELALAAQMAATLDQDITVALGPADPNIASVRELRGLIAGHQGHHAEAARWHLHTTGLHVVAAGPDDPRARASAKRALADWREIPDPAERAAVAHEILPILTAIAGFWGKPTREVRIYLEAQASP